MTTSCQRAGEQKSRRPTNLTDVAGVKTPNIQVLIHTTRKQHSREARSFTMSALSETHDTHSTMYIVG